MKKDHKECNKFKGLRYYAVSSENKIIADGHDPERVRAEAIIAGEMCPIIISSNTVITNSKIKNSIK